VSFDEEDLRRALEARSGEPSPEFRSRVRGAVDQPRPATNWIAIVAVVVVIALTATSVGVLVAGRHARGVGTASGARATSPTPPVAGPASNVQLSAPLKGFVWALVDYQALYVSTDSGDHWSQRSLPDNPAVRPSISFLNDEEGWLLAPGVPETQCEHASATVWRTTDGARTWQRLPTSGISDAQCKESIYFTDVGHGFITAWDDNHRPTVYRSNDGGAGWKSSTLPDNPLFKTGGGGFTLHVGWMKGFGNDLYLKASGSQDEASWHDRDFIYTSTDGGATWTWKQKLASPYTYMVTELRWLQLAPDVEESVNGGQAFSPYTTDLKVSPPLQAQFVPGGYVGYVAAGVTVWRTDDGGAHWVVITPGFARPSPSPSSSPTASPTPVPLPSYAYLSAPSTNVVWVLVAGSLLFVSTDEGDTWQERTLPQGGGLQISFVDATNGWLSTCTQSGTTALWRTTDGAKSWRLIASPPSSGRCLLGLSFVDSTHGFIGASFDNDPPKIYRTADAGATWAPAILTDPPGFTTAPGYTLSTQSVVRFGSALYVASYGIQPAGGKGFVFRSTDGGATWTYIAGIPNAVSDVAFVSATRWLQVIEPDQSEETTDGGKTWHPYATDYSQAAGVAPEVVFGDASVGYATVRGSIQRTTDGGAHWSYIRTPGTA
jgi:photosystem II stability/assembly factor-like uncharacterized protein